eukprot:TRINITY_DN1714_c0_g1_i2.p1 TRINITY_DN1714_c0_g1~~TRINITY_DN1714_c0_g1_i2.p1  ORF type:complete len:485 (+),score=105.08 TRINITY_DN1714_c0_g1_i2:104-1558(+)
MDERVKKALLSLEKGELTTKKSPNEKGAESSCRPWNIADYQNRVSTFSISNWFAKPHCIDPLTCARFGWVNKDTDLLECLSCKNRVYFKFPSTLSLSQLEKNAEVFKVSLEKEAHKVGCPWIDNSSPSLFSSLPSTDKSLIDDYATRCKNIYQHLQSYPLIESKVLSEIEKSLDGKIDKLGTENEDDVLDVLVKEAGLPNASDTKDRVACLLSLSGWNSKEENSLCCDICQRTVGCWNFVKLDNEDTIQLPGETSRKTNKRKRHEEIQTQISTPTKFTLPSITPIVENTEDSALKTPFKKSKNAAPSYIIGSGWGIIGGNADFGFGDGWNTSAVISPTKTNPTWTWGSGIGKGVAKDDDTSRLRKMPGSTTTITSSQNGDIKATITPTKSTLHKSILPTQELNPLKEHRWFCPWVSGSQMASSLSSSSTSVRTDKKSGWNLLLNILIDRRILKHDDQASPSKIDINYTASVLSKFLQSSSPIQK